MYHFAYADTIDESPRTARSRERLALERTIALMAEAEKQGPQSMAAIEAIYAVQRLWSLLIEDLAHPDNALPQKLRADLISVGLWILREADSIRQGKAASFTGLMEVSSAIAEGLQ